MLTARAISTRRDLASTPFGGVPFAGTPLRSALRLAVLFASLKLLLQFALTLWSEHLGYGYFRDEFYFLMCGRHLAWGYVDQGQSSPCRPT